MVSNITIVLQRMKLEPIIQSEVSHKEKQQYSILSGNSVRLFLWAPKSLQMVTAAMKLKDASSLEGKL